MMSNLLNILIIILFLPIIIVFVLLLVIVMLIVSIWESIINLISIGLLHIYFSLFKHRIKIIDKDYKKGDINEQQKLSLKNDIYEEFTKQENLCTTLKDSFSIIKILYKSTSESEHKEDYKDKIYKKINEERE